MIEIASNPDYFTYVADCRERGCPIEMVRGDARLRLSEAPDRKFDVIVVDAFSSDAIPIHLITRQAFELYKKKLSPGGYLLVHISNRFLNLEPVVANIAREMNLIAYREDDDLINQPGKSASDWMVVVNDPAHAELSWPCSPACKSCAANYPPWVVGRRPASCCQPRDS